MQVNFGASQIAVKLGRQILVEVEWMTKNDGDNFLQ